MALIHCTECGKEISDKASTCPHCGAPVVPVSDSAIKNYNADNHPVDSDVKRKDSPLSIISCVFTFVSCFAINWIAIVGVICGLIDLCMNNKSQRHVGSYFGLVVGVLILLAYGAYVKRLFGI